MTRSPVPALCRLTLALVFTLLVVVSAIRAAPASAQTPDLSAALLTLADLPAGWTAAEDFSGRSPADFAEEMNPLAACGQDVDFSTFRPEAGAFAAFQGGRLGPFLFHAVFLAPPGADLASLEACLRALLEDAGITFEMAVIPFAQLGDETQAVRADIDFGLFSLRFELVAIRRGDVYSMIMMMGSPTGGIGEDMSVLESLARRADERLAAVVGSP